MYKVKGLFVIKKDVFISNEHFLKWLDYKAQASKDGFVRIIVTDTPSTPGDPIKYVSDIFCQPMCRAAY